MGRRDETHTTLVVGGVTVDVVRKRVKNLNLSVRASDGRVRLSMPQRATDHEASMFVTSRLRWIEQHQKSLSEIVVLEAPSYEKGDVVSVWGRDYVVAEAGSDWNGRAVLDSAEPRILLPRGRDVQGRSTAFDKLLRFELGSAIPNLIDRWEGVIGVDVAEWRLRKMKTRWGSCNITKRRIWINVELATRDPELLESVVVHEMTHLVERRHNARFYGLMDRNLPDWQQRWARLNRSPPLRHDDG